MNYLEELKPQSINIVLGGQTITVARAMLGKHFALDEIANSTEETRILDYLVEATGLAIPWLDEHCTPGEILNAFNQLVAFNRLKAPFPFMTARSAKPDPLDYPGRQLVRILTTLASAFGWSRDQILKQLSPEEALFYCLEVYIREHENKHFDYQMSQVGFNKQGKKQPFPNLNWRWADKEVKNIQNKAIGRMITRDRAAELGIAPAGLVVDLSKDIGGDNAKRN